MKLQHIFGGLGLGLALLISSSCSSDKEAAAGSTAGSAAGGTPAIAEQPSATESAPTAIGEPTMQSLVARSEARWENVVAGDWIQAYDFVPPELREMVPLGKYLQGKENHEYRNPSKPKVIGSKDDLWFLEVSVLWEPHHPILQTVREKPEDMTEELTMIELWKQSEGDWYFVKTERPEEFLKLFPDVQAPPEEGSAALGPK